MMMMMMMIFLSGDRLYDKHIAAEISTKFCSTIETSKYSS